MTTTDPHATTCGKELGLVQQTIATYINGKIPTSLYQEERRLDGQTQWVWDNIAKQWELQKFTIAAWYISDKHRLRFKFLDQSLVVIREHNIETAQEYRQDPPVTTTTSDVYPWFPEQTITIEYADPGFFDQLDAVIADGLRLRTTSVTREPGDPMDYWRPEMNLVRTNYKKETVT